MPILGFPCAADILEGGRFNYWKPVLDACYQRGRCSDLCPIERLLRLFRRESRTLTIDLHPRLYNSICCIVCCPRQHREWYQGHERT